MGVLHASTTIGLISPGTRAPPSPTRLTGTSMGRHFMDGEADAVFESAIKVTGLWSQKPPTEEQCMC